MKNHVRAKYLLVLLSLATTKARSVEHKFLSRLVKARSIIISNYSVL